MKGKKVLGFATILVLILGCVGYNKFSDNTPDAPNDVSEASSFQETEMSELEQLTQKVQERIPEAVFVEVCDRIKYQNDLYEGTYRYSDGIYNYYVNPADATIYNVMRINVELDIEEPDDPEIKRKVEAQALNLYQEYNDKIFADVVCSEATFPGMNYVVTILEQYKGIDTGARGWFAFDSEGELIYFSIIPVEEFELADQEMIPEEEAIKNGLAAMREKYGERVILEEYYDVPVTISTWKGRIFYRFEITADTTIMLEKDTLMAAVFYVDVDVYTGEVIDVASTIN